MSEQLTQRVLSTIAATQRISPERVTIDSSFQELGIDSMDGVNIIFALENEFNINVPRYVATFEPEEKIDLSIAIRDFDNASRSSLMKRRQLRQTLIAESAIGEVQLP